MALKKSDLYSSLWRSCDELRGGMDVSLHILNILEEQELPRKGTHKLDGSPRGEPR